MAGWGREPECDPALLARARNGDLVAVFQLFAPHQDRIFRIIQRMVPWKDGIREVFHDLVADGPRILTAYQPERGPLGPYLYRTAANRARAVLRAQGANHLPLDEVEHDGVSTPPEQIVERQVFARLLLADILASLSEDDIVILRTCLGRITDEHAARLLGISVQGVRTRRVRLRRRLATYRGEREP